MLSTSTREHFEEACKAYVAAHHNAHTSEVKTFPSGWTWSEHAYVSNLGYLSRTIYLPRQVTPITEGEEDDIAGLAEDEDDAACHEAASGDFLTCHQYVVYSATFLVPTLYFTLHDPSGTPLALDQIMRSALFRPQVLPSSDGNTFALTLPDSSFALLSQGDHPTLGTPSWYFHPCHTAEVVGEIIAEVENRQDDALRWLEAWFMVMGNIVDFYVGE
ncbi:hypothetical protein C8Q74DRAFT_1200480 [Fomes fomentarius]|nr:hypothetical protein C8Q74DRAFT_1200480 [Fomes fomentarius]